jgi:mRNA-degrading endonuclease RelE of RelBE toxin-antitoxin system
MYQIEFTPVAREDLRSFRAHEQRQIIDTINVQLRFEPMIPTGNRKRLRSNSSAQWELRIGAFRVLYDVDQQVQIVEIQRIGEKRGNRFFFRGREEDV